jgi:hypothetical protein
VAVAKRVFNGVGSIVEVPSQPGDPANVSRDDLVYPEGTMHLVNTTIDIVSPTLNPQNCLFRVTLQEDSEIIGGNRAVRSRERHLHRHHQPARALAPQPRRQLRPRRDTVIARGGHGRVQRHPVVLTSF